MSKTKNNCSITLVGHVTVEIFMATLGHQNVSLADSKKQKKRKVFRALDHLRVKLVHNTYICTRASFTLKQFLVVRFQLWRQDLGGGAGFDDYVTERAR
jgi:predicted Zn-dependent peptidase